MARSDEVEAFLAKVSEHVPDIAQVNTVYKLVDEFITASTEGLKNKNTELISENQKLKSKSDNLDADEIRSMLDELKGKSLQDYGDNIRAESADELSGLQSQLSESQIRADGLDKSYQSTLINLELRAAAERARIRPDAIDDFVNLHSKNFQLVDGQAEADGYEPTDYVADVIESAPYWLPESVGGGLQGSRGGTGGINNTSAMVNAAAANGDMKAYRAARTKQKGPP
jgi:hypothetical protein